MSLLSETDESLPAIGIVMGSDSDWPVMQAAAKVLDEFGVSYEARVVSAHRSPPCCSTTHRMRASEASEPSSPARVTLCGLPLGDAGHHSAAMMVNLLGDLWYPDGAHSAREPDWHKLQSVSNLKLHLYGKHHARPGRKMGHFTVLGEDSDKVREKAMAARTAIGIC